VSIRTRARELRFAVTAVGALLATGLALRLRGLAHTRRAIASMRATDLRRPMRPERVARLLHLAARFGPYRPACLVRSLALQRLLRRSGIESQLRIGIRKHEATLDAHAWVEHEGRVLLEAPGVASEYLPFDALPSAAQE
jgi:hypothetical protein